MVLGVCGGIGRIGMAERFEDSGADRVQGCRVGDVHGTYRELKGRKRQRESAINRYVYIYTYKYIYIYT